MSGPMIMMQLGSDIQFSIDTAAYQNLARTAEYKWASQDRFGKNPALQFVGLGEESISIDGVFYPEFAGDFDLIGQWRNIAANGEPLTMVSGRGEILGDWVIEKIDEKQSIFAQAGAARKNEFTMGLKFYDVSVLTQEQIDAARNINAPEVDDTPDETDAASLASTTEKQSSSLADTIGEAVQNIQDIASEVQQSVQPAIDAARQGITIARTLQNAAVDAQKLIKSIGKINSLSSAQAALNGFMSTSSKAANAGASVSKVLKGIVGDFEDAGEIPAAVSAVKGALVGVNNVITTASNVRRQAENIIKKFV